MNCNRAGNLAEVSHMNRDKICTVELRFNEVAGDRPNLFVKWRVRYIEVLFHTFYCNFGRDIEIISFVISRTSLNRGSLNRGSTVPLKGAARSPGSYEEALRHRM